MPREALIKSDRYYGIGRLELPVASITLGSICVESTWLCSATLYLNLNLDAIIRVKRGSAKPFTDFCIHCSLQVSLSVSIKEVIIPKHHKFTTAIVLPKSNRIWLIHYLLRLSLIIIIIIITLLQASLKIDRSLCSVFLTYIYQIPLLKPVSIKSSIQPTHSSAVKHPSSITLTLILRFLPPTNTHLSSCRSSHSDSLPEHY